MFILFLLKNCLFIMVHNVDSQKFHHKWGLFFI